MALLTNKPTLADYVGLIVWNPQLVIANPDNWSFDCQKTSTTFFDLTDNEQLLDKVRRRTFWIKDHFKFRCVPGYYSTRDLMELQVNASKGILRAVEDYTTIRRVTAAYMITIARTNFATIENYMLNNGKIDLYFREGISDSDFLKRLEYCK
jgi:hypothetical protein